MKVLESGTLYKVRNFVDHSIEQEIKFVSKESGDGTTTEELLAVLEHRLISLNQVMKSRDNEEAITAIQNAQNWLNRRERNKKHERNV